MSEQQASYAAAGKSKGGRPRLPADQRLTCDLRVRISAALERQVEEAAKVAGISVSDYVRLRLGGRKVKDREDQEARRLLRQAGRELRRMTEAAGAIGQPDDEAKVDSAIEEIRAALRKQ